MEGIGAFFVLRVSEASGFLVFESYIIIRPGAAKEDRERLLHNKSLAKRHRTGSMCQSCATLKNRFSYDALPLGKSCVSPFYITTYDLTDAGLEPTTFSSGG